MSEGAAIDAAILRVPAWVRLPTVVGVLVVGGFWMVTDSGLWRLLSVWQARMLDGSYFPVLTGALTLLALLLPAIAAIQGLGMALLWWDRQRGRIDR